MKKFLEIPLLLATAVICSPASAADSNLSDTERAAMSTQYTAKATFAGLGPSSPLDPLPDERLLLPHDLTGKPTNKALAQITAANEGNRATIKIANTRPWQSTHDNKDGSDVWTLGLTSWSFAVSAPVDKSGGPTTILAAGGLPSDFQAKINFSQFIAYVKEDIPRQQEIYEQALGLQKACKDAFKQSDFQTPDERDAKKDPTGDEKKAFAAAVAEKCDPSPDLPGGARPLIAKYLPAEDLAAYNAGSVSDAYMWGAEASVGYQKFDFFDALTAVKSGTTGTPWSAKGYAAWSPGSTAVLLLAALEYQKSYKAGTTGTLCPLPAPAPAVLTCVTGAIGAPTPVEKLIASLEFKRELALPDAFNAIGLTSLGLDAKFAYDTKSDVYSFDMPLSFAIDKDKNLVGGVDLGWQSDHHQFVVGLFLSSAFTLFPG